MILPQLTDPAYASGWDHPPEVASPAGHRRCHWKTSQRLFCLDCHKASQDAQHDEQRQANTHADAGSVVCAPIVLYQRFILVASGMNLVVFGTFDTEDDSFDEAIQRRIDTTATAPLTEFPICPDAERLSPDWNDKIIQLSFHEETSILYALSMESCIFQVKLVVEESTSTSTSTGVIGIGATRSDSRTRSRGVLEVGGGDSGSLTGAVAVDGALQQRPRRPLEFTLLHHWVTKKLGATCMATLHGGGGIGTDAVCVGYNSGYIEGWNVQQTPSLRAKPTGGNWVGTQQRRAMNRTKNDVSLQWEGYLHDSIRTLSFLSRDTKLSTNEPPEGFSTAASTAGFAKTLPNDNRKSSGTSTAKEQFLIAIVAISTRNAEKRKQPPTSSTMKVLDLKRIRNETRTTTSSSTSDTELSLQKYALPPWRGAEVMDATDMLPSSNDSWLTKRVPVLESHGADAACRLNTGCVAIAFPDGSIAFLSSGSADESSPGAPWVASCDQQVLLSYPTIGSGQLDTVDANGNSSTYLAACLRGGTCYMIPAARGNHRSIGTIPFPNDMELDFSDVYVQSFTAGNLVVDGDLLPVLVYAWPGGIVDVYSCGLIAPSKPGEIDESANFENATDTLLTRAGKRALRDLIDNDSLVMLSRIVDELRADSKHPLLQQKEWQEFLAEAKNGNASHTSVDALTFDALCSMHYQNLRRILLSMALVTE